MDRHGLQGVGLIILLSIFALVLFQHSDSSLGWTDFSSSAASSSPSLAVSSSSAQAASSKLEASSGFRQRAVVGAGSGRQLLQVATPAPAPGPSSSESSTYISYGALTAGYVPCPPQSGHSYYTLNCQSTTGAANPYTRGCTTISLCTRG